METATIYLNAALAYADGARAFFAPGVSTDERAERGPGPVPSPELASRAETLAPLSAELTEAAAAQLATDDPAVRLQASVGLLAKALTDLQVSRALFDAALDAESKPARGLETGEVERGVVVARPAGMDDNLRLLLGEKAKDTDVERGSELPTTVFEARQRLASDVESIPTHIRDQAVSTGWEALGGVTKQGAGKLAEAAGLVGMEVAGALGQAAELTRLIELVREFLGQALTSLQTLLGPAVTQVLGDQVVGWLKDGGGKKKFASVVETLYQSKTTGRTLVKLAAESPSGLPNYLAAIQGVDALDTAYRQQVNIVQKILKALRFVAIIPAVALPHGRLLMAAAYIVVGGYLVLAGGDYVDAPNLKLLDRVPGVRKVVETNLKPN